MKSIDFRAIPENTLGTVVDSGPLPGDGRTNFAVAGPGAFWNVFGQIADHRRDDRERACSSLAPGRPRATPPRPRARRPRGHQLPAGALLLRGACCVRPQPGASVPWCHTGAQGRRWPATCMCALRPLSACARSLTARNCALLHEVRALARPHAHDDPSFIVLTETKFSFRCIPVQYSLIWRSGDTDL